MLSSQVFEPFQTPAQPFLSLICKMTKRRWTADATTVPYYSRVPLYSPLKTRKTENHSKGRVWTEKPCRAKTEKRDGWTIAQAQWAIQDTQSRDPNWTTEEWKKRGAAITTAEAKKGHTQHTKNSSWWPVRTTQAEPNCKGSHLASVLQNYCLISISVTVFQYVVKTLKCSCCAINLMSV